jgi:hypothetical protein
MNRSGKFSQRDLTRALRAAEAAGLKVSQYKIDSVGNISVFASTSPKGENLEIYKRNEWDEDQ